MTRHLLNVTDFSVAELQTVLKMAQQKPADLRQPLRTPDGIRQGVALIFEKPSNRTRHSMEIAVTQLGGHPVYTRGEEVGLDSREPVEDVARILSGYHGMIAARVFKHDVVARLAEAAGIPVINMLSDYSHPLQGLADALTMVEEFGSLEGRVVAWIGDYNNVARSLAEITMLLGGSIRFACPKGYDAPAEELRRLAALGSGAVEQSIDPFEAVNGSHAVHTDTWVSMGQEAEKAERLQIFGAYQVTDKMMKAAARDAIFMHCLPAYRGLEVSAEVIDGPTSRIIRQGHNRLHSARAAMAFLASVQVGAR